MLPTTFNFTPKKIYFLPHFFPIRHTYLPLLSPTTHVATSTTCHRSVTSNSSITFLWGCLSGCENAFVFSESGFSPTSLIFCWLLCHVPCLRLDNIFRHILRVVRVGPRCPFFFSESGFSTYSPTLSDLCYVPSMP